MEVLPKKESGGKMRHLRLALIVYRRHRDAPISPSVGDLPAFDDVATGI
jgi:hypothetical protein